MMMRVLTALVLATRVASADPTAEQLYKDGQAAYDDKRYDDAVVAWQQSYDLSKLPALMFNLAQAHRLAGHCTKAVEAYKSFLTLDPKSDERPSAEQFLRELEPCPEPLKLPPKPIDHKPTILPSGMGTEHVEDRGGGKRMAGLITGGAGIAVFATGLYFGNRASSIANEVEAACEMGCEWSTLESKDASGRSAATLQYVFYGVGAAAIIGGATLYFLGARARETRVFVAPTAGGATAAISGRF
jgi:serine/threonine-protein kinase